jgi:hypothetical protein
LQNEYAVASLRYSSTDFQNTMGVYHCPNK